MFFKSWLAWMKKNWLLIVIGGSWCGGCIYTGVYIGKIYAQDHLNSKSATNTSTPAATQINLNMAEIIGGFIGGVVSVVIWGISSWIYHRREDIFPSLPLLSTPSPSLKASPKKPVVLSRLVKNKEEFEELQKMLGLDPLQSRKFIPEK